MIYILSFLGIIIENSLPLSGVVLVVTLPFSLQTNDFAEQFVMMAAVYYLFNFIFINMVYNKENIVFISLLQIGVYFVINYKNCTKFYLILNLIGFLIINYFYVKHMKKKNIRGQK